MRNPYYRGLVCGILNGVLVAIGAVAGTGALGGWDFVLIPLALAASGGAFVVSGGTHNTV